MLNLARVRKQLGEVDKLSYLGSCILPGGGTSDEPSSCIQKPRLIFVSLLRLWQRRDIRL